MKKRIISVFAVAMCAALALCACGGGDPYTMELADLGGDVAIHTALQAEFLAGDYNNIAPYADGMSEKSLPEAVHFEWKASPAKEGVPAVENYVVEISQWPNFRNALSYSAEETQLDVYNLRIATEYYWRVTAVLAGGKEIVSDATSFTTSAAAPRNLYVDGITNVRDLGGWQVAGGGSVRQGAIIRCGRLNRSETTEYTVEITEKGIATMTGELGIRTEIDLRDPVKHSHEAGGITAENDPLGESVQYINIPLEWSVGNLLTGNTEAVRAFFEVISDESNYPVIFHCNIGTDRTGLFAFLINGLLGVSEEDLYRDYMFSNFGKINGQRFVSGIETTYVKTVKSYGGDTLSEQIENCLLELVKVPKAQIDSVKALMLE